MCAVCAEFSLLMRFHTDSCSETAFAPFPPPPWRILRCLLIMPFYHWVVRKLYEVLCDYQWLVKKLDEVLEKYTSRPQVAFRSPP